MTWLYTLYPNISPTGHGHFMNWRIYWSLTPSQWEVVGVGDNNNLVQWLWEVGHVVHWKTSIDSAAVSIRFVDFELSGCGLRHCPTNRWLRSHCDVSPPGYARLFSPINSHLSRSSLPALVGVASSIHPFIQPVRFTDSAGSSSLSDCVGPIAEPFQESCGNRKLVSRSSFNLR